jgi:hypothetical protein
LTFAFAKVGFDVVRRTDSSGIATISVACNLLKDTTLDKVLTITAITNLANIAQ